MARDKHQAEAYAPDPHGWYQEDRSCVEQLFDAIEFGDDLIWDPSCGTGNILNVARDRGHPVVGSDIIMRGCRHEWFRANFLTQTKYPRCAGRRLSIVCNPPFNTPPGSGLAFMLRAIEHVPFRRAAFVVPLAFLCGQDRYDDLFSKHRPSHVAYCSQRPSMPPGTFLEEHGEESRKGGKNDFVWIVFSAGGPYRTESIWLKPDRVAETPSDRRLRRGSQPPSASANQRK